MEAPGSLTKESKTVFQGLREKAIEWAMISILGFLAVNFVAPLRDWTSAMIHSPSEVQEIKESISALSEQLDIILGNNRVIRERPELAYVVEPVALGGDIELVIYLGRSEIGGACVAQLITPIFEDSTGATRSGISIKPTQQISAQVKRRSLTIKQPPDMLSGHTAVWLQVHYKCAEEDVFESTSPVLFTILE